MQTNTATVTSLHFFDFGQGRNAPADINEYLGRIVICYNHPYTVVAVESSAHVSRRVDGSVISGAARLFIARRDEDDPHGFSGHWTEAANIASPGKTILHWGHDESYRAPKAECEALYQNTLAAEKERREAYRRADEKRREDEATHEALWEKYVPSWAKGYIIAEFMEDDSDSMTDYFASHASKIVLLGFSKHDRNLFPEMRKFAAAFPPTAELAENGAEHREDYSGGHGFYLAGKRGKYAGWNVRKMSLRWGKPRSGRAVMEFSHYIAQQGLNEE